MRSRTSSAAWQLADADAELLLRVPQIRGGPEVLDDAGGPVAEAVAGLAGVYELLAPEVAERVIFDLGLVRKMGYYTGAVFDVYDPALGAALGGGGHYDDLLGRFGRPLPAVGFALTIDRLHIALTGEEKGAAMTTPPPTPTSSSPSRAGALMRETLDRLDAIGIDTSEVRTNDRKLLFADVGIVTMRPSDVPTYVEAGAADVGITGKDVLAEQPDREVYELLDLDYGKLHDGAGDRRRARPVGRGAAPPRRHARGDEVLQDRRRVLRGHRPPGGDRRGQGSVELAPLTGLVEAIVDLTATGTTLRENNLVIREEIFVSTARLIANPVSHKLKAAAIDAMLEKLRAH